ncbi:hypothetical protein MX003_00310 [Streptococcus uberis]|uniref:hypothetical protein n=1 Tax=Streptococcus uberis TaxID=1349 RepID=UPI0027DCE066|nr:hypothetical protein [Streptococcus uberis]MCK1236185.1 hypothetical protein [Streptococcus uberis]
MSRINWIKKWIDEGLVNEGLLPEQIEILSDKDMYLCKDIGDTDSVIDMLIYEYHDYETWNDFNYSKLSVIKENYESCDRELKIAVSLKNWEFERDLINFLKDQEKSAVKKNKIETDFLYFEKLFYPNFEDIKIEIDSDGINYLSAPENVDKNELNSVIVNCSFSELKKII